jgi:hypothetical protein
MHQLPHLHSWLERESGISQVGDLEQGHAVPPQRGGQGLLSERNLAHALEAHWVSNEMLSEASDEQHDS